MRFDGARSSLNRSTEAIKAPREAPIPGGVPRPLDCITEFPFVFDLRSTFEMVLLTVVTDSIR